MTLKHVLVPLDGSELAERALAYAQKLLERGGRIDLLTVVDTPDYPTSLYYPAGLPAFDIGRNELQRDVMPQAEAYLAKVSGRLQAEGFHVTIEAVIGEPADAIIEQANKQKVDAIVMSTHGRSGFSRWLFGSVANKVISGSCRPIFIVPAKSDIGTTG